MTECRRCAEEIDRAFRYCPWCGAPLRIKVTELFEGSSGKALRVSRYFGDDERAPEVRLSLWGETLDRNLRAEAAVSLSEEESVRLAGFLAETRARDQARTL